MPSGGLGRTAIGLLRQLMPAGLATRKASETPPTATSCKPPEPPPNAINADTRPKMLARHLPPVVLLFLIYNEFYTWRTPAGLAIAFGLWLFRTFVHLRQGAFILKNSDGLRPLRFWVCAEVVILVASSTILGINAIEIKQPAFRGLVLLVTALSMVFVARCERLKIVDERSKGDIRFESGTSWLINHTFDKTLSLFRVAPKLGNFRLVPFVVNIVSIAATIAFFPQIPATEYAALAWTKNLNRTSHKSMASGQTTGSTNQPSAPGAAPTYDDDCIKTHKGVEPGAGAPSSVGLRLHSAFYDGGPGEHYTGCFDVVHRISADTYYQVGKDEQTGRPKSVIIAATGCPTSLTWGDDTASFLALLNRQIPVCPDIQHEVGPGDVRFLDAPDGTYVFVRPNEVAGYATLSPAEAAAWVDAEGRLSRWLWPIRNADGLLLQDRTTAPVDLKIVDNGADVVLIQDGKSLRHFVTGNGHWTDVRSFAETVR